MNKMLIILGCSLAVGNASAAASSASRIVSGEVTFVRTGEKPVPRALTPDELNGVSQWWGEKRRGWTRNYASASSAHTLVELVLRHADGFLDHASFKTDAAGSFVELRTGRSGCADTASNTFCDLTHTRWLTQNLPGQDMPVFWKMSRLKAPPSFAIFD